MSESISELPPDSGMETGSDAGTPGDRNQVLIDPGDATAAAVADDAPLPSITPEGGAGPQDDGLTPQFSEPADDAPDY